MRMISRIAVGALALGAALGTGTAAHAQDAPGGATTTVTTDVAVSPELQQYLDTLTPAAEAQFVATRVPATTEVVVGEQQPADARAAQSALAARAQGRAVTPQATGCWTQRWTWGPKAAAGNTLYTYYHVGYWCSSGTRITAARIADAGGETKTVGWRYEGITARSAGIVSNQGRSYTQHKFVLGVGGWDVQSPLECARVKGLTSGTSQADSVCGIY